jgi:hypothetical protein
MLGVACVMQPARQLFSQKSFYQLLSPNIHSVQNVDADGLSRPQQLPMASGVQRRRSVLIADIREARVCRDLPLAQLHQATGHVPRVYRHGLHHVAV